MAFIGLIFTALKLRKLQKELVEEKLDAIKTDDDKLFKKKFRFRHIGVDIKVAFKKFFRKIFGCSEKSPIERTCYKLGHEGSYENYILKSVFGFIGGVLLTYLLYIFFIFQLNVKLTTATVICSFLGCILTVGLAFSSKVRCVVLLTLPQFFSKRGRQALLAYAFALALTGPAQNTLNNMGILSESLACGQEQLKQAVKQIIDVIKKPFVAIKDAIKKVIKTVKEVVKKIKEILLKIKRIIMALVRVIKAVFEFLGKIINICNKELGTPFERCTRVFENAIADCNAKLGPLFNWLCSLTYIVKAVCYIVKVFDYVCMLVDFISDSVVGVVIRKVKTFVRHIKTMFYVRIKFSHSFDFKTTASKSITEIAKAIIAEIKGRSKGVVAFFNFMTSAAMLFFLYLVFQVAYYRIKFLTSERFDNIYITKYFREIDMRRAKLGKETVLPLNKKEEKLYVPITSAKLAKIESKKLSKSAVALATASVKLGTHMVADYSLYWILTMITYHGRYQSKIQAPNMPVAHISGEGFIAVLLRAIVNAFQPVGIKLEIDTVPCLPIPIPPDFDRYVQIAITLVICWILTVLEPYGLRFRNYIMGYYHPVRAKQRTIWLYNHILRSRSSFLLFARRQLRRKFGGKGIEEVSCKEHLRARLRCGIFRICLGNDLQMTCLLCGEVFRNNESKRFVKCSTPECPGLFCLECFADLNNICPICLSPIEYGDLDELDEEKDSSGDEPPPKKRKKKRKCPWLPCGKSDDDDQEPLVPREEPEEETKDGPDKEEESDSSTDYSSTYQYDEDLQEPYKKPVTFIDVEKQHIPDYASMESFRDETLCINLDNIIEVPKDHAAIVKMDVTMHVSDEYLEDNTEYAELARDDEENKPLIEDPFPCICSDYSESLSPRHVEFIGVPNELRDVHKTVRRKVKIIPSDSVCCCSDIELLEHLEDTSLITLPKSTMSTSTRSDCKYCRGPEVKIGSSLEIDTETEEELRNVVPKLDLSFLNKENKACFCDNPILSQRFRDVTYETICETPPSSLSNRTLESSSLLTSLENSPSAAAEQTPLLRRRNVKAPYETSLPDSSSSTDPHRPSRMKQRNEKTQNNPPEEVDSPSSMDSFEFNRAHNRRVRQYYKSSNKISFDNRCQNPKKRRPIENMFRKLIPKRKTGNNYLPLHRCDIDDSVEIRSYNYSKENWDTLSLDTDSPTYPFETQVSSDSSEEDLHLLGRKRIRGGECTHFVNCRLLGRSCPQKRVRSFDAKSEFILGRTLLKDFSRLSLPPKPKPANTKELLDRYFLKIKDPLVPSNIKYSMKSPDADYSKSLKQNLNLTAKRESSDYIINKSAISVLTLQEDATPPSSDSGLSENTCLELFGGPCPRGLGKQTSKEASLNVIFESTTEQKEAEVEGTKEEDISSTISVSKKDSFDKNERLAKKENSETKQELKEKAKSTSSIDTKKSKDSKISKHSVISGSQLQIDKVPSTGSNKSKDNPKSSSQENAVGSQLQIDKVPSTESSKSKDNPKTSSQENTVGSQLQIDKFPSTESSKSKDHPKSSSQENTVGVPLSQSEDQSSTSQGSRQSAKRKSTQLNQLLYKDDKTEISLVQKLSPDKGIIKSGISPIISTQLSPRQAPSVKLQIALHNSIIQDDTELNEEKKDPNQSAIEMTSPKSKDKIVETQETFPLRHDWVSSDSSRTGKLILASDKTQQTSDNDIYRSSNNNLNGRSSSALSSTSAQSRQKVSSSSEQKYTSSDPYYSGEEPERDLSCKNNCRCSICINRQMPRLHTNFPSTREECNCCRCLNLILEEPIYPRAAPPLERPVKSTERDHVVNAFPPSTSESAIPLVLPPLPPRPPHLPRLSRRHSPHLQRPRVYSEPCYEECSCCLKQRQLKPHGYSGDYEQPSTSSRYPGPRIPPRYKYRESYDQDYDVSDDDECYYHSHNRNPSMTDLPYQNNEEYLELVEELQDTLQTRNRNRVKRAMQEFEDRSKHNKPLEKPIINYDEASESEEPIIRKIDQLRTDRKICCAEEKCSCVKRNRPPRHSELNQSRGPSRRDKFEAVERPSHWTMDPSSGEWFKACKCSKHRGPKGAKGRAELNQCTCNCERNRYQ